MRNAFAALAGWRTLIFAVLLAVGGVLQETDWTTLVDKKNAGWIMLAIAIVMAALRSITSDLPGWRRSPDDK